MFEFVLEQILDQGRDSHASGYSKHFRCLMQARVNQGLQLCLGLGGGCHFVLPRTGALHSVIGTYGILSRIVQELRHSVRGWNTCHG